MAIDDILGQGTPYLPQGPQGGSPQYVPYHWDMPEMATPPPSFPMFHQPPPEPESRAAYNACQMSQELFEWFMHRLPDDHS